MGSWRKRPPGRGMSKYQRPCSSDRAGLKGQEQRARVALAEAVGRVMWSEQDVRC